MTSSVADVLLKVIEMDLHNDHLYVEVIAKEPDDFASRRTNLRLEHLEATKLSKVIRETLWDLTLRKPPFWVIQAAESTWEVRMGHDPSVMAGQFQMESHAKAVRDELNAKWSWYESKRDIR